MLEFLDAHSEDHAEKTTLPSSVWRSERKESAQERSPKEGPQRKEAEHLGWGQRPRPTVTLAQVP